MHSYCKINTGGGVTGVLPGSHPAGVNWSLKSVFSAPNKVKKRVKTAGNKSIGGAEKPPKPNSALVLNPIVLNRLLWDGNQFR